MSPPLTPHGDVNEMLALLLQRQGAILGEELVGLYLYGSLATGDFDRESSDIDFVAATAGELSDTDVERLRQLHACMIANGGPWGGKLEGAYISVAALRRYNPAHCQPFLSSQDTPFSVTRLGPDWVINRHILCTQGIVVYGPHPATLIDPVSAEELTRAVREELGSSWRTCLGDWEHLRPRRYQAYSVLTLCRALYALERGGLVSKPAAAAWAMGGLEARWTVLIQRALAWPHDPAPDEAALPETLDFVRYAVGRA